MSINIIVAYNQKHVIGKEGDMPWHLPADLAYFKKTTMGCPIVMGRKTRESLGRPLPGRLNIAITRDTSYQADGTKVVYSLSDALAMARAAHDTVFVIGGGEIYRQSLAFAHRVYATEIHNDMEGDTHFPVLDTSEWREVSREPQPEQNGMTFDFVVYERK
ncbi:dihydrofolate reductase [Pelistega europaea]|uniref:Dihydrofolate reductase n=1 Tax=Pelistega europaea TaxID=106147 RepID=A0A7Y4L8F1_9BURK|nr:dihydrofolate reductase [Pelistega europaea]NOL48803.1 dihydrofolate reductase [Pelistega europaea]